MLFRRSPARAPWANAVRKVKTLESFSRTEADGGRDILAAARRVADPDLKRNLERHAADELRHAELFHRRAAELRSLAAAAPLAEDDSERAYDLSRGRPSSQVDAHGFFTAGRCDELGEVAYIAMLHVAERRAQAFFEEQRGLVADDPVTQAIFDDILRDEKFHAAYTAQFLKRWRKAGRGREVELGLRSARGERFLGAWKRFGARSAGTFGRVVLFVAYASVLVPFALLSRLGRGRPGWRAPRSVLAAEKLRSQYE